MAIFIPLVTKFDDKGLQGAQRALAGFANFATDVARVAVTALAGVGVASVREAAQFETTFAKIQGLVGLTTEEVEELQEAARRLGPQFGKSGNEAGQALFFITSSGLRGADAVDVLEASLKGAAIGLGDMTSLANAATAAVNTFGSDVLTGTQAVDAIAEAVRLGQFAPEELAGSIGRVLPIAAELGISLQETLGLVAGLTRGGLNAAESVTGLRGAYQAFLKPSAEATRTLQQYGFSVEDVRESIVQKGFLATMIDLRTAFGDNDDAITKVFGSIEGLNSVLALTGANVGTNTQIVGQMTDQVGVLDEAMALVSDTAQFRFDVAMATARDSLIDIGGALLEDLLPYLDRFQTWVNENGDEIEQAFINIFGAIDDFAQSESLARVLQAFEEMWPDVKETVKQLGDMAGTLVPILLDALGKVLPSLQDAASIIDDIGFFTNEAISAMEDWNVATPGIIDFLEKQLNPISRLRDALKGLADILDRLRDSYERARGVGVPLSPNLFNRLSGSRAGGGPVAGGNSYLVGEMGPEIFTPAAGGGTITPNNQIGGATYNITVNAGMGTNGAQLGEAIVTAIRRYEKASGPVFARA